MSQLIYNSTQRVLTLRLEPLLAGRSYPREETALEHIAEAFRLVNGLDALGDWRSDGTPAGAVLSSELANALTRAAETAHDIAFAEHLARRALAVETSDFTEAFLFGASHAMPYELLLGPAPSYLLPPRNAGIAATLARVIPDPILDELDELDVEIGSLARRCLERSAVPLAPPSFAPPLYSICDLISVAGGAATPPFHFAHFLPEDEGIDGVTTKTVVYRNLYLMRFQRLSLPLLAMVEKHIDEAGLLAAAPATLLGWLRTHDMAHSYFDRICLASDLDEAILHATRELLSDLLADALLLADDTGSRRQRIIVGEKLRCARRDPEVFADALAARAELAWLARAFGNPLAVSPAEMSAASLDLIVEIVRTLSVSGSDVGAWLGRMAEGFIDVGRERTVDDVVPLFPASTSGARPPAHELREWIRV